MTLPALPFRLSLRPLLLALIAAAAAVVAFALPAAAQTGQAPMVLGPAPDSGSASVVWPTMSGFPVTREASPIYTGTALLTATASLTAESEALQRGLVWHVFAASADPETRRLPWAASDFGGSAEFRLAPGEYMLFVGLGHAWKSERVTVSEAGVARNLVLEAGGLALEGTAGNAPIRREELSFTVYGMAPTTGEWRAIVLDARPGDLIILPRGNYYTEGKYGSLNAERHAEVLVEPGRTVTATLEFAAAHVVLKLVQAIGGDALANTSWSIATLGSELEVATSTDSRPSLVLAAGEYVVVASNGGQTWRGSFTIVPGQDIEVEIIAAGRL